MHGAQGGSQVQILEYKNQSTRLIDIFVIGLISIKEKQFGILKFLKIKLIGIIDICGVKMCENA